MLVVKVLSLLDFTDGSRKVTINKPVSKFFLAVAVGLMIA
jgi:hypothetical protein